MKKCLIVIALFLSSVVIADARGFEWFFANIKPSGECGFSREVAASNYSGPRRTASGRRGSHDTIASWDHPFGTRIRVTNPFTGLSAVGTVWDRGPSKHRYRMGLKLDLWDHLAARIKLGQRGRRESGWVCMEVL